MIDHRHYVPLLKWKRGEQRALKELPADIKASFTPIFEMCFNADPDTGLPASPVAELVDRAVDAMFDSWPKGRPFFLDAGMFAGTADGDRDGSQLLFHEASDRGLAFTPVVGLTRSPLEMAAALKDRARGACLRLALDDNDDESLASQVDAFIAQHNLDPGSVWSSISACCRTIGP